MQQKSEVGIYSVVPIQILLDGSITPRELKVYIAIASFQGKSDSCNPSLNEISQRTGINPKKLSSITASLVRKGWLYKKQIGCQETNVYSVRKAKQWQ